MTPHTHHLTRTTRFALTPPHPHTHPIINPSPNNFAGHPPLTGIAPFLTLTVTLAGTPNPSTGMLLNIKQIDDVIRHQAVPLFQTAYYQDAQPTPLFPGTLLTTLFRRLQSSFTPCTLHTLTLNLSPYLYLTIQHQEPSMVQLTQRFEFSAAHRLHSDQLTPAENQATFGKCNNPHGHGHNYELEVTLAGTPHPTTGQLLPIELFQQIVNTHIIDRFDHKHLNLDCPEFVQLNPTVENITRIIYDHLLPAIPPPLKLHQVTVWETPKTYSQYPLH